MNCQGRFGAQGRQFTGGQHGRLSGAVHAVGNDLRVLVRRQGRRELPDLVLGHVERTGQVRAAIVFLRERSQPVTMAILLASADVIARSSCLPATQEPFQRGDSGRVVAQTEQQ